MRYFLLGFLALGILVSGCGKDLPTTGGGLSEGYDRVVLAELYTGVSCPNCPAAEAALDRLFEEKTAANMAVIHWHSRERLQGDLDGLVISDTRLSGYNDNYSDTEGLPTCQINGLSRFVGANELTTYDAYHSRYNIEHLRKSPIDITVTPQLTTTQVISTIKIETIPDTTLTDVELTVVLVEHEADNTNPFGPDVWSYIARVSTTQDVELSDQAALNEVVTLDLEEAWGREHLYIVAFVQEKGYGIVVQAAMIPVTTGEASYGITLTTDQTIIEAVENVETAAHFTLQNSGTVADTFMISIPEGSQTIPANWIAIICDESLCYGETYSPLFAAGQTRTDIKVDVTAPAPASGSGDVVLLVTSKGDPTVSDSLTFTFTVSETPDYTFSLSTEELEINGIPSVPALGPFELRNTSDEELTFVLEFDDALSSMPAMWAPMICDHGTCYTPPFELTLSPDEVSNSLEVDLYTFEEGVGDIAIRVSVKGYPTITETVVFNYTIAAEVPGFERVVAAELVTTLMCNNCPEAEEALDTLLDEEGMDKMAVVHWHPTSNDALGTAEGDLMEQTYISRFCPGSGLPVCFFGAADYVGGGDENSYTDYKAKFDLLRETKSPAKINVTPELLEGEPGEYSVNASIEILSIDDYPATDLQLKTILVEHDVPKPIPYGPAPPFLSYVARYIVRETVTVDGSQSPLATSAALPVDTSWNRDNLYVVVFLQEPNDGQTIQAAMVSLP